MRDIGSLLHQHQQAVPAVYSRFQVSNVYGTTPTTIAPTMSPNTTGFSISTGTHSIPKFHTTVCTLLILSSLFVL